MNTETFEKNYTILNDAQREAVDSLYGPIMVVAGPWTGKTQIIWLRTANIILKAWVHPENILITTFTDAWVIAIRQRLVEFIWEEAYKVNVSTIHSFSQEVIQTFPEKFIAHKAGTPIDDIDQMEIFQKILEQEIKSKNVTELTSEYDPLFYLRDIASRISTLKQEWISPEKLETSIWEQESLYAQELSEIKPTLKKYETTKQKQERHIQKLRELVELYKKYNTYLNEASLYDFNDMIRFVLEAFQSDEELRLHYAETYQFIMLDEYQDTNNPQNEIINLILSAGEDIDTEKSGANIMVVGDDDQSIYRFQWANIENMLDFYTVYPSAQFIVLENNYRSNQAILDTAKTLIEHNEERLINRLEKLEKKLISEGKYKNSKETPTLYQATNDIDERAYVLTKIRKELENTTPIDEIALIVRSNKEVKLWSQFLSQNGIENESRLQGSILESEYVAFILSFLRVIDNPFLHEKEFMDILRTGFVGVNQIDIVFVMRHLYRKNYRRSVPLNLIDILSDTATLETLWLQDLESIQAFQQKFVLYQKKLTTSSLVEFLGFFIEDIWILEHIHLQGNFDDIQDIYTLLQTIKKWTQTNRELTLTDFFKKIDLYIKYNYQIQRQILKKPSKWVQVMTAHSSKWLEYDVVFIPWLYTGNWDSKRVIDRLKLPEWIAGQWLQDSKKSDQEEDRRLFFVALTRAKDRLHLSYPAWVDKKPLLPSLFLEEIHSRYIPDDFEGTNEQNIEEIAINEIRNSLIDYGQVEFDYIQEFLDHYKLSPSDFNTFLRSPLEFLNRVIFKYPFSGNKFTIFWSVYHRTLELFFLKYKDEQKIPEKSYLTSTFESLIKREFLTQQELSEAREKWIAGLEGYYDLYASNLKEPFLLEYSFRHKNIFFEDIPLTGTIDKVEKIGETQNTSTDQEWQEWWQMAFFRDSVRLIDYKTGKSKSENVIKGLDRYGNRKPDWWEYFRQMMFYRLLCEHDRDFMSQFQVADTAIDFVEGKDWKYSQVVLSISPEEYSEFQQELRDSWAQIRDINFWKELIQWT